MLGYPQRINRWPSSLHECGIQINKNIPLHKTFDIQCETLNKYYILHIIIIIPESLLSKKFHKRDNLIYNHDISHREVILFYRLTTILKYFII